MVVKPMTSVSVRLHPAPGVGRVCRTKRGLTVHREGSSMSHHYSGPDFGFPDGDARLDLTDLYAFPKPGDAGKSILIMNVHPSASVNPPGLTVADPFAPDALYELKIDTDGDAVADIAYRVRFSASAGGTLTATLRRGGGNQAGPTRGGGGGKVLGGPGSGGGGEPGASTPRRP